MEKFHKSHLYTLIALTFIGLILRLQHINHSLWLDEIFHVVIASKPLPSLLNSVAEFNSSPPLDYLIVKIAIFFFGTSDWGVRMPALILGIASIPVFYLLCCVLINRNTAVVAATLFVFSPMAIYYSQEARMYSLFLFLSLMSYYLMLVVIKKNEFVAALFLGMVNGLLILTHYFGMFVIIFETIILSLYMLYSNNKKRIFELISIKLILSFFVFLPWLFSLSLSFEAPYSIPPDIDLFKSILTSFSTMTHTTGGLKIWIYGYIIAFSGGVVLSFMKKERNVFIAGISFCSFLCALFLIAHFRGVVTVRNLIFLLPMFLLVCAYSINSLLMKFKANYIVAVCILTIFLIVPAIRDHVSYQKPDWKGAATYISKNIKPGERVITTDFLSRGSLAYYLFPEAEYVPLNNYWLDSTNKPSRRIWIIDDELIHKINDHHFSGWAVISPATFGLVSNEDIDRYNQLMGNPRKQFKFKNDNLNVFYLISP